MKCGERALLPAVREAAKDALIITDGFSCREQIAQTTDRQAVHLAQVIRAALHRQHARGDFPERTISRRDDPRSDFSNQERADSAESKGVA